MNCKICKSETILMGTEKVLRKYDVKYYQCKSCGYIQTENPFWLNEAYARPINLSDTGLIKRNLYASKIILALVYFFFSKKDKFLDVAGGYGVLTRLMRDYGLDFYWSDPYTQNLFANNFEGNSASKYALITSIESFEHFEDTHSELDKMLKFSKNIFFSTELQPLNLNLKQKWYYWAFEHGQHISFHTYDSLRYLANSHNLNFYSYRNYHLFTEKKISTFIYKIIISYANKGLSNFILRKLQSKTLTDSDSISKNVHY